MKTTTMMTMTMSSSPQDPRNHHHCHHHEFQSEVDQSIIRFSGCSSTNNSCWKLYENPFFTTATHTCTSSIHHQASHFHKQLQRKYSAIAKHYNGHGNANGQDLNKLIRSSLTASMDRQARAQIAELKAELDLERKVRRKMEAVNKRLAKELAEERSEKEDMEKRWEEMRKENLKVKGEMAQMRRSKDHTEAEHQRDQQMLQMADQADRLQMKLAITSTDSVNSKPPPQNKNRHCNRSRNKNRNRISPCSSASSLSSSSTLTVWECAGESKSKSKKSICVEGQNSFNFNDSNTSSHSHSHICSGLQRKMREPESENPHIKRGIKGFVEFPRVVKLKDMPLHGSTHFSSNSHSLSNASKGRDMHMDMSIKSKLECQKAQLQVLFKHKTPLPSNPLHQYII